jgi:predicted dehydrogenase
MTESNNGQSRRDFLKTTTAAATTAALATSLLPNGAYAAGNDLIKVGLIGCGGRGTQAAENVLQSAQGVEIVAIGDVFEDRLKGAQRHLTKFAAEDDKTKRNGNVVNLPDGACHRGLKAYQDVINSTANYIILATPPGFRPLHLEAAIAAGKNIFTEKPVGVDGPGINKVLKAYEASLDKKLAIVAGTQRRHQKAYLETLKRIHDGEIGELVGGRVFWNQNILWKRDRKPGMSDVAYQIHNWYGFPWICGDHIVEQHVHNLDVLNWAFNAHPVKAVGMGYRVPRDEGYGVIFNFFAIDYEYPKHVNALSMCRQISKCANEVGEHLVGTKGQCHVNAYNINGQQLFKETELRSHVNPYVQEHTDLIASIRAGKPLNELKQVAESTLTAIMGRMSAYTGEAVTWDRALNSKEELMPNLDKLDWNGSLPPPRIAEPGKDRVV